MDHYAGLTILRLIIRIAGVEINPTTRVRPTFAARDSGLQVYVTRRVQDVQCHPREPESIQAWVY